MQKLLKLYMGYYIEETRDTREMLAAKEAGYKIEVLSYGKKEQFNKKERYELIKDVNEKDFLIFRFFPDYSNKKYSWKTCKLWIKHIKKLKPDVISGHDLEATLIGYLYNLTQSKNRKARLVYDAHELEMGRNIKRTKLETFLIMKLEKFIINRCALSIMVNDSIADEVKRIYKLTKRPLVIRSTPPCWKLDEVIIANRRKEMLKMFNANENEFIMMYHGGILTNRGIELLINIVKQEKELLLVIMGYAGDDNYLHRIKRMVRRNDISNRIIFLPAVPPNQIWEYAGAVDCGILMIQGNIKSYYLCLPNKFFENIQSLTPMIASNFPEIKKLIDTYDIGLTCNPSNINEIINAIYSMRYDKVQYEKFKQNLIKAKQELCWEKEKKLLVKAYKKIKMC